MDLRCRLFNGFVAPNRGAEDDAIVPNPHVTRPELGDYRYIVRINWTYSWNGHFQRVNPPPHKHHPSSSGRLAIAVRSVDFPGELMRIRM